jgi:hypothetical protein
MRPSKHNKPLPRLRVFRNGANDWGYSVAADVPRDDPYFFQKGARFFTSEKQAREAALDAIRANSRAAVGTRTGGKNSAETRRTRRKQIVGFNTTTEEDRIVVFDDHEKAARARRWVDAKQNGSNLGRLKLASRFFPELPPKTARTYMLQGLARIGQLHLWTEGAPGPKKRLPSNR